MKGHRHTRTATRKRAAGESSPDKRHQSCSGFPPHNADEQLVHIRASLP